MAQPGPKPKTINVTELMCAECGVIQPIENFYARADRPGQRRTVCKSCVRKQVYDRYPKERVRGANYKRPDEKLCPRCRLVKPLDAFYRRSGRAIGVTSKCKDCAKELDIGRERRGKPRFHDLSPEERRLAWRANALKKIYGMTLAEFDERLASQGGTCAVCGGPPHGRHEQYQVDHCHECNAIRGLLCHKCNVALGMVQDSPEHLLRLLDYLDAHCKH